LTGVSFLGVDLGATNIKMVVVRSNGDQGAEVGEASSIPTHGEEGHDVVIERLVSEIVERNHAAGPFAGVGVGTPGLFDPATGVVQIFTNLPGQWRGVRLRSRLVEGTGLPITLINDARAFTLAEGVLGAGRGHRIVVCMTLGTGIGGGIIMDGRLFMGATGIAGEIAHQTVLPDGPVCGCGNRGCAEVLARSDVLAATAGKQNVKEVFAGLAAGEQSCIDAVNSAAGYLGIALANVVTVIGPDRIVIGGGIAAAGEAVLGPIREATKAHVTLTPHENIDIVRASLGPQAGAIGAALAAIAAD
jgi:glucokinase